MKFEFIINEKLPSLNQYIEACRKNAYAGKTMKAETDRLCYWYIKKAKPPKFSGAVHVTFEWFEKDKRRDPDNISGYGHKTIFDALVQAGVLPDDNSDYVAGYNDIFHYKASKKTFVRVTMEEVTPEREKE